MATTTTRKSTRAAAKPKSGPAAETSQRRPSAGCNLTGCPGTPEWRGLCSAHRQTHRGLADPKAAPREEEASTDD